MENVGKSILDKGSIMKHDKIFSLVLSMAVEPTAWFLSWVSLLFALSNAPSE